MSSSYVCANCQHIFRMRLRHSHLRGHYFPQQRVYIQSLGARQLSSLQPTSRTVQPQAYEKANQFSKSEAPKSSQTAQRPPPSPVQRVAKQLRKRASVTTETYIAYGVCEDLVKKCANQADYRIPQAQDKNVNIPKTKNGEDLGIGKGWWYQSMLIDGSSLLFLTDDDSSGRSVTDIQYLGSSNLLAHVHTHMSAPNVSTAIRSHLAPTFIRSFLLHGRGPHDDAAWYSSQLHSL